MDSRQKIFLNYYNPRFPKSFSGLSSFAKALREKHVINEKSLNKWASSQPTISLHKYAKKKFPRSQVIVNGIDDTWQADLIDMRKFKHSNRGSQYILSVIDVFSKFAWAIPLKDKSSKSLYLAFKSIFDRNRIPLRIQSDQGNEFLNSSVRKLFKSLGIKFYYIYSKLKACVVERFNRTLKEKIWRYFTFSRTHKYIDVLQDLIDSYNNSYHRSIKTKPILVDKCNEDKIWMNLYGFSKINSFSNQVNNILFEKGEIVRISIEKDLFAKGFTKSWSKELYTVKEIILSNPVRYILEDLRTKKLKGSYYSEELQKVDLNSYKIFEKVLDKRKVDGSKEYLVKFIGSDQLEWIKR